MGISTLMEDPEGLRLITEAGLGTPPRLQGSYGVDLRQLAGEVCDD
jgi:hypothetical protein